MQSGDINKNCGVRTFEKSILYKSKDKLILKNQAGSIFSELWKLTKGLQPPGKCFLKQNS